MRLFGFRTLRRMISIEKITFIDLLSQGTPAVTRTQCLMMPPRDTGDGPPGTNSHKPRGQCTLQYSTMKASALSFLSVSSFVPGNFQASFQRYPVSAGDVIHWHADRTAICLRQTPNLSGASGIYVAVLAGEVCLKRWS